MASKKSTHLGISAQVAEFAARLSYGQIPKAAIDRLKLCILDTVGCATFATTLPWGCIISEYVIEQGGSAEAFVWGTPSRVPASMAALANGTLIHGFELDDLHKASILHPSSAVLPAALALAEARGGVDPRAFLTACVAGFEVGIRAGLSVGTSHLVMGFHPTGTHGAPGAGAAAASILRLSPRESEHAISIAATQAAGLMSSQFESMVKRLHAGRAAQAGVVGAQLAAKGFTGIDGVFEADYGGYSSTLSNDARPQMLTDGLGHRFETEKVGFKSYSCCGSCHTSVEAVRRLQARHAFTSEMICRIEVFATHATFLHVGWAYEPRSVTAAQMNGPYCVAVTAFDGEAFVEQFSESRIQDPLVVDLARRVEYVHDAALDATGPSGRHSIRMLIHLNDGRILEEKVSSARGSESNPLSSEEVIEKFRRLAVPIAGESWASEVFDLVMSIDRQSSTQGLTSLLGSPFCDPNRKPRA